MASIPKNDFQAALGRLESMAKAQPPSQLYHTPADSDPGSWAGTQTRQEIDENTDGIDDNGTDYAGVKKALAGKVAKSKALTPAEVAIVRGQNPMALIGAKISKGQKLTAAESWAVKKGFPFEKEDDKDKKDEAEKAAKGLRKGEEPGKAGAPGEADDANSVPETHAGQDEDDEIESDAKKSLDRSIANTDHLRKGLNMSPILVEFARAMGEALKGTEARTAQYVSKSLISTLTPVFDRITALEKGLERFSGEQGDFNKSFAETIVGIGQHVAGSSEIVEQAARQPAGGPRSVTRAGVTPIAKSFAGPGGLDTSEGSLAKAQIIDRMANLVEKGKLSSLDVVKYEMTGEISPQVQAMVLATASA